MALLRYAAKFDPFLSLDCAPTPSTLAQSKERKGSNFAIWQPCSLSLLRSPDGISFANTAIRRSESGTGLGKLIKGAARCRVMDVGLEGEGEEEALCRFVVGGI